MSSFLSRLMATCALAFLTCLATPALAQSCWSSGTGALTFGTVSHQAVTDAQTNLSYTCQSNGSTTYFRLCMAVAEGQAAGVNPRLMVNNNSSNAATLKFDVYSNAARSSLIGLPPTGGAYPNTWTVQVAAGYAQQNNTAAIYGRVHAGQDLPSANTFQAIMNGSQLSWAWSNSGFPPSCTTGAGGNDSLSFYLGSTAQVSSACRITLATDMDFGSVSTLGAAVNQSSGITVRCPSGTPWNLGLNNGSYASGTTRRMRNAAGQFVTYELYRNTARTQRWGGTVGTDTQSGTGIGESSPPTNLPVYGRVPVQGAAGGTYTDTVIITLTY